MSADSYTINVTGNSNNTDLILESGSSVISEGGTNTIEQTIVADPSISNDYDVNNLGEIRNVTADGIHNLLDLEFSSKHPWTKALKETWNTTTLGDVGTQGLSNFSVYPEERRGTEIGRNYFSRNARDVVTKNSHFTSVPAGNILEIDTTDYEKKKGYINFWECINRTSVRSKIQYGTGSETFADHPETYLNFYGTIKSSSPQLELTADKKVLYVHGGMNYYKIDGTNDLSYIGLFPGDVSEESNVGLFTYLIAFALDDNEELVKKPNGLVADPLIVQRIDKHLILLDPSASLVSESGTAMELITHNGEKDFAIKRHNNKDIVCLFNAGQGGGVAALMVYKLEFNRVNHSMSYNGLTYSKEITLNNGLNIGRAWELKYCDVNDRFIMNGRFNQGGESQNHVLFAMDANFTQGDDKVGEIELFHILHETNEYAAQLLEEVGGLEAQGKTWMQHNGFFKTSNFFVYGGKVFYFLNVLRIIDTNFGLDASANLSKLSYAKDYKNPETCPFTQSGGLGGYHADLTNQVVLLSMMTGGFASGTTLNSRYNNEAGAGGNEGRSAQVTIVIPFSQLQKSDAKTWKVNVVADRITYTQNMYSIATCFDDKGNAYHSGGYLQSTPGDGITDDATTGYEFGLLRVLVEDDNNNKIDYLTPNQQIFYKDVNYDKKYYNYIWDTRPTGIDSVLYNQYTFRCQVLGLENNIKLDSKLTETGLNISKDNLINVNYGVDGLDMHYNGRNSVSVKQSEDAILHLTSSNRNTIVGSNNLRSADLRFASKHKDNIIIGSGVGNVPVCENNIMLGNNIMNFKSIRDSLVIGNDNKAVLVGDLSNGTLQLPEKSFETAKSGFQNRQVYEEFKDLNCLYNSFGIVAGYGLNKFDMPREIVSQLDKLTNKMNELIVALNASTNGNIEPTSMGPQGIKKLDVELLIDIGYDGWSSEVYGEILTNNLGKVLTIDSGSLKQTSISSLNPLSFTGSIPLTDSAANGGYNLYKFPIEMDVDNNIALIYWSDEYGDLASHTHIVLEDKFKYMDFPHAYGTNFVLPVFAENTPTGNELTVAMLRVINTNIGTGALANTRIITTACELTNNESKINPYSDDYIINKVTLGNRIGLNMSQDNTPGSGIGPYYPVVKFNFETTNPDGTIKNWAPMTVDSAIREWFKDGETYSGWAGFPGHRKGHMFNIADCVDKASVKVCILDGEEAEDNVVPGSEVLFAPHIEGEVGPDATWDQRFNSALNLTGGSFWADNNITYKTTEYGVTDAQMKQLLQDNNPTGGGGYYQDFAVWNPLVMLVHMPQSTWGQAYVIKLDVDLTPYGLRKEHIEMRFVADSY